jgi:hypothetical protein
VVAAVVLGGGGVGVVGNRGDGGGGEWWLRLVASGICGVVGRCSKESLAKLPNLVTFNWDTP